MAEMTMISMAVMAATQKSRSFLEAAAGRKDLYLEEGLLEEGTLEIGTLGIALWRKQTSYIFRITAVWISGRCANF